MSLPTPDPLLVLSTDSVAPQHRYDYWCQTVFGYFDADPLPPDEALAFEGHVVSLIGERGEIHRYRSSAVSGRRTQTQYRLDTGDEISISYMLAGEAIYEPEGHASVAAHQGMFFCYDSARASRLRCTKNRQLNISLPRAAVIGAIGGPVPEPGALTQALNASFIAPYLVTQMRRLMREAQTMTVFQRITMLDATLDLARAVLRGTLHPDGTAYADEAALYAVACSYLEAHLSVPGLTAAQIAHALGCSRAHLYRVFAQHGTTVADRLREVRLRRARRMLEGASSMDVATIAWRCGYADASSFGKAFKRRFGTSPQDWRVRLKDLSGSAQDLSVTE